MLSMQKEQKRRKRKKPVAKRLARQIIETHSLPHWTGYQKDLAHYIRSTTRQTDSTTPVAEVLEHILQPAVLITKIKIPDPQDGRRTIEITAKIVNLDTLTQNSLE